MRKKKLACPIIQHSTDIFGISIESFILVLISRRIQAILDKVKTEAFIFFFALTAACGNPENTSQILVTGGELVTQATQGPALSSTLALTTRSLREQGHSFCTATLVSKFLAVTAAHCVLDEYGSIETEEMLAVQGSDVRAESMDVIEGIAVHQDYRPEGLEIDPELAMHDLALIRLSGEKFDNNIPVKIAGKADNLDLHAPLLIAGYGVTSTRENNDTGTLRQVEMKVSELEPKAKRFQLMGPIREGHARMPTSRGREKIVRLRAGACAGDSGGPAYLNAQSGKPKLIGVASFGLELPLVGGNNDEFYCAGQDGYTDLRSYQRVLKKLIKTFEQDHSHWPKRGWFNHKGEISPEN